MASENIKKRSRLDKIFFRAFFGKSLYETVIEDYLEEKGFPIGAFLAVLAVASIFARAFSIYKLWDIAPDVPRDSWVDAYITISANALWFAGACLVLALLVFWIGGTLAIFPNAVRNHLHMKANGSWVYTDHYDDGQELTELFVETDYIPLERLVLDVEEAGRRRFPLRLTSYALFLSILFLWFLHPILPDNTPPDPPFSEFFYMALASFVLFKALHKFYSVIEEDRGRFVRMHAHDVLERKREFHKQAKTAEIYDKQPERQKPRPNVADDDAHFLSDWEVEVLGFTKPAGIPLGILEDKYGLSKGQEKIIRYGGKGHLMTFARTGYGKHAHVQVPALLEWEGSALVIDPKGEAAAVTARYRRDELKQQVYILNPFEVHKEHFAARGFTSACFNPLASINPRGANFVSDVDTVCNGLIVTQGKEPFFDDNARMLVAVLVMFVLTQARETLTIPRVRQILNNPDWRTGAVLLAAESACKPLAESAQTFITTKHNDDGTVSKRVEINKSALSAAQTQLDFLKSPELQTNLSRSDFSFEDMKREGITVYLILPAGDIRNYSKWFRLLVAFGLKRLQASGLGPKQVLFMLDEFALLQHVSEIENAFVYTRGAGVQVWPFMQQYSQLTDLYGNNADAFMSNADVLQFFTPTDMTTAGIIERLCGEKTVYSESLNVGSGVSHGQNQTRKPLYSAHALRGLPMDQQLLFFAGNRNPIKALKLTEYFNNPLYMDKADDNPMVNGG